MKVKYEKLIAVSILIVAFSLFLSTIADAKPFTDAFRGGLIQINDFFQNEGYKPYAKTIDFFFFSLLFIAIYMMGARYAFKEVKRPEQAIAILLGLMTAFLLVLGGFSATILLPWLHWLFYILLFILYWWLLKGIKNKFWRFLLALLLTLLTIALLQGLFGALAAPEVEAPTFFKDLAAAFKGIEFPGVTSPGIPQWLQDLYGAPTTAPTGPTTLPTTPTPPTTPVTPTERGFLGRNWGWLIPLAILLAVLAWAIRKGWLKRPEKEKAKPKPKPTPSEERTVQDILNKIDEIIRRKIDEINKINRTKEEKNNIIQAVDKRQAFLNKLAQEDIANIFTDEARQRINQEGGAFKELYDVEKYLIDGLINLKYLEEELYNKLSKWNVIISRDRRIDMSLEVDNLKILIGNKPIIRNIKQTGINAQETGIIWLIVICYDIEKREIVLSKELADWLKEDTVEELVQGKFTTVKSEERKLSVYNAAETKIIRLLEQKIQEQINLLKEIKRKLSVMPPPRAPYAPPYGPPYRTPYAPTYGPPPYGHPPYGAPTTPPYGAPYAGPYTPPVGRLKVLMLSFAHPTASNGISTVLYYLIPALKSLGVDVELLTKWYGEPFYYYPDGFSLAQQFNTIDEFLATKSKNEYSFIHAHAVTFAEQINPPDPTTYWNKLINYFKVPSAYTVHFLNRYHLLISKWRKDQKQGRKWVGDVLEPYIMDRVNVIIQLNRSIANVTDEIYPGKNYSTKTVIIPNGVDLSTVTLKTKPKSGEIDLLYLGRLDRSKGMYELCVAFGELYKKYPNLKLNIVGEGAPRGKSSDFEAATIKRILRMRKIPSNRFIIHGVKHGQEKEDILNNSDFVVMPSYAEYFSMVALEAISHKKPLIASTALGLKEAFIDTGLAYPIDFGELRYTDPSDSQKHYKLRVKKIVEVVSYCIEHIDECNQRAELAYQFLRQNANIFDWRYIAKKTKEVYESLITTGTIPKIEVIVPKIIPPVAPPPGAPYVPPYGRPYRAPYAPPYGPPTLNYILTLTPLKNIVPNDPIRIIGTYHEYDEEKNNALEIGKGEDVDISLADTKIDNELQIRIWLIKDKNKFFISHAIDKDKNGNPFKVSPETTLKIDNNLIKVSAWLSNGNKITINDEYEFSIEIESEEKVLPYDIYVKQFPINLSLVEAEEAVPKIILKIIPKKKEFNQRDSIELEAEIKNLEIPSEGFKYGCVAFDYYTRKYIKELAKGTADSQILGVHAPLDGIPVGKYYICVVLPEAFPEKPVKERYLRSNFMEIDIK